MADVWEKDLAQKSSLTTNDFIRVVGSDNVSYKQQVSNVTSALGIDPLVGTVGNSYSGDANALVNSGQYQVGVPANVQNLPSGVGYGFITVLRAMGYVKQTYYDIGKRIEYVRTSTNAGENWNGWEHDPADAPIRKSGSVAAGASFTIELNNSFSQNEGFALVQLNISGNAMMGVALLFLGRGTSKVKDLLGTMLTSYYTATYSNNSTWTITNNSSSVMYYTAIISK